MKFNFTVHHYHYNKYFSRYHWWVEPDLRYFIKPKSFCAQIPNGIHRGDEIFTLIYIFISSLWRRGKARRWAMPLNTQCLPNAVCRIEREADFFLHCSCQLLHVILVYYIRSLVARAFNLLEFRVMLRMLCIFIFRHAWRVWWQWTRRKGCKD